MVTIRWFAQHDQQIASTRMLCNMTHYIRLCQRFPAASAGIQLRSPHTSLPETPSPVQDSLRAIIPEVERMAHTTGEHIFGLESGDPLETGFLLP